MFGFAESHRWSGERELLDVAERCAGYYLRHAPADGVPYWDFGAPGIPNEPRDSSAAAIAACAFSILGGQAAQLGAPDRARRYRRAAQAILETLAGEGYLARGRAQEEGILLHGVYHRPRGWGVDASVMWGDYFFLEAIERVLADLAAQE
jgi:unsaturated chondroitin disaccharide hydrolase